MYATFITEVLVGGGHRQDGVLTGSGSGKGWENGREVVIKFVIKKLSLLLLIQPHRN